MIGGMSGGARSTRKRGSEEMSGGRRPSRLIARGGGSWSGKSGGAGSKRNCGAKAKRGEMGGNGLKEWNGMRGGGGRSLSGFKTSGARAKVCDEVLTDLRAFGFGGFGRCEG